MVKKEKSIASIESLSNLVQQTDDLQSRSKIWSAHFSEFLINIETPFHVLEYFHARHMNVEKKSAWLLEGKPRFIIFFSFSIILSYLYSFIASLLIYFQVYFFIFIFSLNKEIYFFSRHCVIHI